MAAGVAVTLVVSNEWPKGWRPEADRLLTSMFSSVADRPHLDLITDIDEATRERRCHTTPRDGGSVGARERGQCAWTTFADRLNVFLPARMSTRPPLRVLRVYHGGRDPAHRARERALRSAGAAVTLVVPSRWPGAGDEAELTDESFRIVELAVQRAGDVNRHTYVEPPERVVASLAPDILDIHEEPFSVAARQWLSVVQPDTPVVMYTAQNVDKRLPPPFAQFEREAHRRVAALYPCSAQAAAVARGKGFAGLVDVIPLGYDDGRFTPGSQSLDGDELVLALFGRLVVEKGVTDAVEVLARVHAHRPARLVIVGSGPEEAPARARAAALGVADRLELIPWQPASELAATYRRAHVVLVPSYPTETWVEQFGRVIVEAQASGAVVAGYASGSIAEVAGDAAILTDVGAVSELADQVLALADSGEYGLRRERGIALSRERTWARVAERQVELYRRVARGDAPHRPLPGSPRQRRELARVEFGGTAATVAGLRPFALPLLRKGGAVPSAAAAVIDASAELAARVRRTRQRRASSR